MRLAAQPSLTQVQMVHWMRCLGRYGGNNAHVASFGDIQSHLPLGISYILLPEPTNHLTNDDHAY
jgi:hypothetical protein